MRLEDTSIEEMTIKAHIGQLMFTVWVGPAFFDHAPHQTTEKHNHAAFEFHFMTQGICEIYAGDEKYEAASGSYYIIKDGIYHMQKKTSADLVKRYSFKFRFDIDDDMSDMCPEEEIKSFMYALSNICFYRSNNLGGLMHIISDIRSELKQKAPGHHTKAQYLFSLLFINILREMVYTREKDIQPTGGSKQKDRMRIIENFFEYNVGQKVTLKELGELVNLSKSQLNRILREKYNMSFKQKHIEVQIEHIKDMLANTDMSINEISERMGYTSAGNFISFFKQKTGSTPKAFRKTI